MIVQGIRFENLVLTFYKTAFAIVSLTIMKKQLEDLEKNPIVEKFKKLLPRKEKLICDYFN